MVIIAKFSTSTTIYSPQVFHKWKDLISYIFTLRYFDWSGRYQAFFAWPCIMEVGLMFVCGTCSDSPITASGLYQIKYAIVMGHAESISAATSPWYWSDLLDSFIKYNSRAELLVFIRFYRTIVCRPVMVHWSYKNYLQQLCIVLFSPMWAGSNDFPFTWASDKAF